MTFIQAQLQYRQKYDRRLYKMRRQIEHFLAKLKQFQCIATRCDATVQKFPGAIHLAAALIWLN
jgi:transposase